MAFGDQSRPCATVCELVPLLDLCRPTQPGVLNSWLTIAFRFNLSTSLSTREERMFDVSETLARALGRLFTSTSPPRQPLVPEPHRLAQLAVREMHQR